METKEGLMKSKEQRAESKVVRSEEGKSKELRSKEYENNPIPGSKSKTFPYVTVHTVHDQIPYD